MTVLGTVDEVVAKIRFEHELYGPDRFLMQMPHDNKVLASIELLDEVRDELAAL